MNDRKIIWGIFGTGRIAENFVSQLIGIENVIVRGVASRKFDNASQFADKFGIKVYKSYLELCQDPSIDVVYVALPTRLHFEYCGLVLDHNKSLLCEKPFTQNWKQANEIIEKARNKNLFCMEAMWMRFNPLINKLKKELDKDSIGKVSSVHIELGYKKPKESRGNYQSGKGATLSFGCYGISLANYLFGVPQNVEYTLLKSSDDQELNGSILFQFTDKLVHFFYSEESTLSNEVTIYGTDGFMRVGEPFIDTRNIEIINNTKAASLGFLDRTLKRLKKVKNFLGFRDQLQSQYTGFKYEAIEVNDCISMGLKESTKMPLKDTLMTHKIMEDVTSF